MNKQKFSLLVTTIALVINPAITFAATQDARMGARLAQSSENKCEAVTNHINARINNLNTRRDNHIEVYQSAHTRWVELAARLKTKGYDTSKLEADLSILETMVTQLSDDYKKFLDEAQASLTVDCTASTDQFRSKVTAAKQELATFRVRAKQVHDFIKNTIKSDLRALRQQAVKPQVHVTPGSEE